MKIVRPLSPKIDNTMKQVVPETVDVRSKIEDAGAEYIQKGKSLHANSFDDLSYHAEALLAKLKQPLSYKVFSMVVLYNEISIKAFKTIPYNRRLLLLPYCLRDIETCGGKLEERELTCAHCGSCSLDAIKRTAEKLGYTVLIAEDASLVFELLLSGNIDGVLGIACLDRLVKVFPKVVSSGVVGISIPLLRDGCKDTAVDIKSVIRALTVFSSEEKPEIEKSVKSAAINKRPLLNKILSHLGDPLDETEQIAIDWVRQAGKRLRSMLALQIYSTLTGSRDIPEAVAKVSLALEIFHKASLIHDDIEDGEKYRYNQPTTHRRYSVPVAINVGDYLVGKGYNILASTSDELGWEKCLKIVEAFSRIHISIARGQGEELLWSLHRDRSMIPSNALRIYGLKTGLLFEFAILVGTILAERYEESLAEPFARYGRHIGISYQILDDIADVYGTHHKSKGHDILQAKPTLLFAISHSIATEEDRKILTGIFSLKERDAEDIEHVHQIYEKYGVIEKAKEEARKQYQGAIKALSEIENTDLRNILKDFAEYQIERRLNI